MQLYLDSFYSILRQQKKIKWTTELQKRFEELKTLLTERISNTIPDPDKPFYAMCDASKFDIGAALLQSHSETNKMNLFSANWKHPTVLFTDHKPIIFSLYKNQIQTIDFIDFNYFKWNFQANL